MLCSLSLSEMLFNIKACKRIKVQTLNISMNLKMSIIHLNICGIGSWPKLVYDWVRKGEWMRKPMWIVMEHSLWGQKGWRKGDSGLGIQNDQRSFAGKSSDEGQTIIVHTSTWKLTRLQVSFSFRLCFLCFCFVWWLMPKGTSFVKWASDGWQWGDLT